MALSFLAHNQKVSPAAWTICHQAVSLPRSFAPFVRFVCSIVLDRPSGYMKWSGLILIPNDTIDGSYTLGLKHHGVNRLADKSPVDNLAK